MNQFITRPPLPGQVIASHHGDADVEREGEFFRVLLVNSAIDRIVFIRATPKRSAGRLYFSSPRVEKLSWLLSPVISKQFTVLPGGLPLRPDVRATAEELDKKYLQKGQEQSFARKQRTERYAFVEALINAAGSNESLFDPDIRAEQICNLAQKLGNTPEKTNSLRRRITDALHQYWAEGSLPGSVTPFTARCGGRGKERRLTTKKPGARNIPTRAGEPNATGHILSEEEKAMCGFGWRNYYLKGTTIAKAHRKFLRQFFSDVVLDENGDPKRQVRADSLCPTKTQFEYWGLRRSEGHESWRKQLSPRALARIGRVLFGDSNQAIVKIGQRGAIDSTTTDVELVSVIDRLKRIGQAHRVLIVDGKYKYIPGFYMGLDAPGSLPVQLAYLHAMTDKTEWLRWLGLENQDPNNWIPIRFSALHADNTDARAKAAMAAIGNAQTGIKFIAVSRSDLNSDVETTHHSFHRLGDHNLAGTTHGQRTERGEERADALARLTIVEAIRETARLIYLWNTMEIDIEPTLEMQRDLVEKGIKLTRANLTRWEIERGNLATCLLSEADARMALLIPIRGTFTQKGIQLLDPRKGDKREFIPNVRYVSNHKVVHSKCIASKVSRSRVLATSFDDDFLHDPYRPSEIYYRDLHTGELIPLEARTSDPGLLEECALPDVQQLGDGNKLRQYAAERSRERQISDVEGEQERTNQIAEEEYQKDLAKAGKPPSRSSIRKGKKANREAEKEELLYGQPLVPPESDTATEVACESEDELDSDGSTKPAQAEHVVSEPPTNDQKVATAAPAAQISSPPARRRSVFTQIVRDRQTEMSHA
ncbi:hypothetical protein VVD49_16380 [Uliginosibacterium sp. H3]|uniref:Transposase n=1 Tax=Uliginosibacterium silvisoli TaxID=3114758 RepID=A0ABU6K690_9RHOO|nr:hypothetical protein [Uliginosibacterium sp. H3]